MTRCSTLALAIVLFAASPQAANAQEAPTREEWRDAFRRLGDDLRDLADKAGDAIEDGVHRAREGAAEVGAALEARRVFREVRRGAAAEARERDQAAVAEFLAGIRLDLNGDAEVLADVEVVAGQGRLHLSQGLIDRVGAEAEALPESKRRGFRQRVLGLVMARELAEAAQARAGRDSPREADAEAVAILARAGYDPGALTQREASTAVNLLTQARRQAMRDGAAPLAGPVAAAKVLVRYGPAARQANRALAAARELASPGIVGRLR